MDDQPPRPPCMSLCGAGNVQLSIWKNRRADKEWYSCKISRRFKREGSDKWESTEYLAPRDLMQVSLLCQEAAAQLTVREKGPGLNAPANSLDDLPT